MTTKCALIIGCGYVGSALAKSWSDQGILVTATTTSPDRLPQLKEVAAEAVILRGNDLNQLQLLLQNKDYVILTIAAKDSQSYTSTYLDTAQCLVTALKGNNSISQIVYTSSTSVYGDHHGDWVDESTPLAPANPQTVALANTEQVLMTATSPERSVCILRLGEIIGPERSIMERLRNRRQHPLPGDGSHFTNLTHINDIVGGIDFAVQHHLSGIYNLCNDLHISRKDLYNQICEQQGWPPITWDPSQKTMHGGNKKVSSVKIVQAGYSFCHNSRSIPVC